MEIQRYQNNGVSLCDANRVFINPEQVLEAFEQYVEWLDANKLKEAKLFGSIGEIAQLDKMRMPTMQGFCRFIRITMNNVSMIKSRGGLWKDVFDFLEDSIYAITVEGAAAGLLKESISAKILGITDKIEVNNTERRVIIMHTPDNGRVIEAPLSDYELLE